MSARCPDGHGPNTICGYCVELTGATLEVVQAAAQALREAYGSRAVAGVEAVAAVAVVKAIAPALKAAGRAEAAAEMRAQIADLGLADEDAVALMAGFAEGGDRG